MKSKQSVSCAWTCAAGLGIFLLTISNVGMAHAATLTVNGSYTVSYTPTTGNGPSITDRLGTWVSGVRDFSEVLTLGGSATAPVNFITATPNSCESGSGFYCNRTSGTASGTIAVTFAFTTPTGATGNFTETGLYQAKYGGSFLSCSGKSGYGQSDCINWSHINDPIVVSFTNGDILDLTLFDAEDWAITPTISFQALGCGAGIICSHQDSTPLPAALPLFASGLGGFGLLAWRRKRKAGAVAA